jgi:hypothetical protein
MEHQTIVLDPELLDPVQLDAVIRGGHPGHAGGGEHLKDGVLANRDREALTVCQVAGRIGACAKGATGLCRVKLC